MRKDEIWAVEPKKVLSFFRDQTDLEETEAGFRFSACQITVTALPHKGERFWRTPQTRVVIEGPDPDVNTIYRRFFLQFLSAGG